MSKASKGLFTNNTDVAGTEYLGSGMHNLLQDGGQPGDLFSIPADDVGNPGFEIGISAPTTDVGNPGFEIGISAPTTDDVVPADNAPAGDSTSSGDAGDSLLGLGTWESVTH